MVTGTRLLVVLGLIFQSHGLTYRLPRHLQPNHYVLEMLPLFELGNWTALGKVWVQLNCTEATDVIAFNAKEVEIASVSLTAMRSSLHFPITDQEYNNETEIYKVKLDKTLEAGEQYRLHIKFKAVLNDLLQGFYRSSYKDNVTQETRSLVATQFSPTDARRAFPCWDEPDFKAKFTITIGRPGNMTSNSNMPLVRTSKVDDVDDWYWDHYKTTPPMSTYLVAFMVSDLVNTQVKTDKPNFTFKVWSRADVLDQTSFAGRIGPRILSFLERYFRVDFPLPKLDMVALPDLGFSGMENWGLITFRESSMLFDPKMLPHQVKRNNALTISHEIVHQWFGNLVTPAWWSDLWLKEGFATYIGYIALNNVEPKWNIMGDFLLNTIHPVMRSDSLNSSHMISNPVPGPKDIRQNFGSIAYKKGASIIFMMNHFLGEDVFRRGLELYLMEHKFGNAKQSHLWRSFTRVMRGQELDIAGIMDSWTLQPGYPVVTVIRDFDNGTATLTQERFLLSGEKTNRSSWWIPVSYTTEENPNFQNTKPSVWMPNNSSTVTLTEIPNDKWLLVNINRTGFYRVNYDYKNWELLSKSFLDLPQLAQAQLLSDSFNLASAGVITYNIPLSMSKALKGNSLYMPWKEAAGEYNRLLHILQRTDLETPFKNYLVSIVPSNLTLKLNVQPEDRLEALLISSAMSYGQPDIIKEVDEIYRQWMNGKEIDVGPELKNLIYCTAIEHGGKPEWDFLWEKFQASNEDSIKNIFLSALGCSNDTDVLNRFLNLILDKNSGIRLQNANVAVEAVAGNKLGAPLALQFIIDNWQRMQEYFGLAFNRIGGMISSLSYLNTKTQLEQLEKLYADHQDDLGTAKLSLLSTMEQIKSNIKWLELNSKQFETWLRENSRVS